MNFNSTRTMMWNTQVHQNVTSSGCKCASTTSNQIPPLMWETSQGHSLKGCQKKGPQLLTKSMKFLKAKA
jgi:hypothetical protein